MDNKIIFATSHKPVIKETDTGIWRRIVKCNYLEFKIQSLSLSHFNYKEIAKLQKKRRKRRS